MGSSLTIEMAAHAYRIPLIDYDRYSATGCLVSAGCGIGMAVMDQEYDLFRYFVDTDQLTKGARLVDFAIIAQRLCQPLAFVGIHSLNPRLMIDAVVATGSPFYAIVGRQPDAGPKQVESLDELHAILHSGET